MYKTKVCAKLNILTEAETARVKAIAEKLEKRGKFPKSLLVQPDLLLVQSVILTTGRPGNLNDDVMLNEEILPVLYTAFLKPFNVEHSNKIVGTIFDAFAVNRDTGEVMPSCEHEEEMDEEDIASCQDKVKKSMSKMPERLDIVTNQVIWSQHFPIEATEIKRKAIAGEMFVSMELWFGGYDYLVGNRVVQRNEATSAVLDPVLRVRGGEGFLGPDKVRRILRKVTFAGNAAVVTPANPDSFILDVMDRTDYMDQGEMCEDKEEMDANARKLVEANTILLLGDEGSEVKANLAGNGGRSVIPMGSKASNEISKPEVAEVVTLSEEKMDEKTVQELIETSKKLAVTQADLEKASSNLASVNKEKEELQVKIADLEKQLQGALEQIEAKKAEIVTKAKLIDEAEAAKKDINTKFEAVKAQLNEIEEARKLESRKAIIAELKLSDERAVKLLAKTAELGDEAFASEIADIKAMLEEVQKSVAPKEEKPAAAPAVETPAPAAAAVPTPAKDEELSDEEIEEVLEGTEEVVSPEGSVLANASLADEKGGNDKTMANIFAKSLGINLNA